MRVRTLSAGLLAAAGLASLPLASLALSVAAPGASAAATACPSSAVVKSVFGGTVPTPTTSTGTSGSTKTTTCGYGSVVSIGLQQPSTSSAYQALLKEYKNGNPTTKTVSGIGGGAFSYDITNHTSVNCTSSGKCTTITNPHAKPTYYLTFLWSGKAIVDISGGTSTTLAKEEALAKKIA